MHDCCQEEKKHRINKNTAANFAMLNNTHKYVPFARIALPESGIDDTKGHLCMSAMIGNFEEVGRQIGGLA